MFIFNFTEEDKNRTISLEELPYLKRENQFPGYYEWYGEVIGNYIVIYRRTTELCYLVNEEKGLSELDYYYNFYKWKSERTLIKREDSYRLVNKYYEDKYGKSDNGIKLLKKDEEYKIDNFYCKVKDWGKLKWDTGIE